MRVNFGYLLAGAEGDAEVPPAPVPDFVVCCNNYCTMIVKWYENLAKELGIPVFMIDMPFNPEGVVDEARVRYIRAQFDRLVGQLEDLTGRPFDRDRFREVMEVSREVFADHPVNRKRAAEGKLPGNSVWLWGQGKAPRMPTFRQRFGLAGSVVAAVDLIKGIGIYAGLEVVK